MKKVGTNNNPADLLTKVMNGEKMRTWQRCVLTPTTVAPAQLQRFYGRQARVQRHEANKATTTQSIEAEGECENTLTRQ